jgi:hypothetical protein
MHLEILNPEGTMETVNWSEGKGKPVIRKEVVSVDFHLLDYVVTREAVEATQEAKAVEEIKELKPISAIQKLRFPPPMTPPAIRSAVEVRARELASALARTESPLTIELAGQALP